MVSTPLSLTDLAWAAGVIDGEGCIHLTTAIVRRSVRRQFRLDLTVGNTDIRMLQRMKDMFGGIIYSTDAGGTRRTIYQWRVQSARAAEVLAIVRPYLVIKGEQADVAQEFAVTLARVGKHPDSVYEARGDMATRLRLLKREAV